MSNDIDLMVSPSLQGRLGLDIDRPFVAKRNIECRIQCRTIKGGKDTNVELVGQLVSYETTEFGSGDGSFVLVIVCHDDCIDDALGIFDLAGFSVTNNENSVISRAIDMYTDAFSLKKEVRLAEIGFLLTLSVFRVDI